MQYRTDLAMERAADYPDIAGVCIESTQLEHCACCEVRIESAQAAQKLQKPCGRYITLEIPPVQQLSQPARSSISDALAQQLRPLLPMDGDILVIGLGNRHITSDSLGTQAVESLLVTRHLREHLPASLRGRLRGVCALSPGVLGITGIETADLVRGVVAHTHPSAVIAIDALSAREVQRIGTVIQITDTGIQPGSGVGNHRADITADSMGVPVIALGVPTVVYGGVIIRDALQQMQREETAVQQDELIETLCQRIFEQPLGELVVTPREIDQLIAALAQLIGMGLNMALHPKLTREEMMLFSNESP